MLNRLQQSLTNDWNKPLTLIGTYLPCPSCGTNTGEVQRLINVDVTESCNDLLIQQCSLDGACPQPQRPAERVDRECRLVEWFRTKPGIQSCLNVITRTDDQRAKSTRIVIRNPITR